MLLAAGEHVIGVEGMRRYVGISDARVIGEHRRERDRGPSSASPLVENVGDGLGGEGVALVGGHDGVVEVGGAVLVKQSEEPRGGAAEVSAVDGDLFEERHGVRACDGESSPSSMLACVSLVVGKASEVLFLLDGLAALVAARMVSDDGVAVEDANPDLGGDEGQGLSDESVRDGVVVGVEADIGSFPRGNGADKVAGKGVRGRRQEPRPLEVEGGRDGALVDVAWDDARMRDGVDPLVKLGVEMLERVEGPGGEKGLA
jgi:hypothetical protein